MVNKNHYFNLIAAQRYFHFVSFQFTNSFSIERYWKECGKTANFMTFEDENYVIGYASLITDESYYTGNKLDYSVNMNRNAPFHYDLFVVHLKKSNVFIFGFPFQSLGKRIVDAFIKKHYSSGNFIKADLRHLVKSNVLVNDNEEFFARFSGVELKLTGDLNITSVNLDGDKPLESDLYKTYFKMHIEQDNVACKVEKCSIKLGIVSSEKIPLSAANIHLDLFGNIKIYIHGSGNNIFALPYLFDVFTEKQSLEKGSSSNPLNRIKNEQP